MTTTIVSLRGVLRLDDSDFRQGVSSAKNQINSLSGNLRSAGASVTSFGAGLTAAFAPSTLALGAGISQASNFADSMKEIETRAGLTADEMATVEAYALSMGAATQFSGQQAADALLELLTSGDDVETAMQRLPQVLDLAGVADMGLGQSADAITDIMAAFRMEAGQTELVVNALSAAAGSSSANVESLAQGFANLGPVANQMGIDVESGAAMLAILAENGIKGAESGTALKSMLTAMQSTTPATVAAWDELGTSLFDADGNARNFDTVLQELNVGLANKTPEEQSRLIKQLAGSYGQSALMSLLATGGIGSMTDAMGDQASASDLAAAKSETFSGKMNSLQGSVETLAIQAITPFINDVLIPLVDSMIPVINSVTDWAVANPQLTATIVGIMAALAVAGPLFMITGAIISGVGTVVGLITGAFNLFNTALKATKIAQIAATVATTAGGAAMTVVNGIVSAGTVALGAANVATGGLAASMMAAAAPILAVGAAIAGVIATIHTFKEQAASIEGAAAAARDSYDTTFNNDGLNQWGEDVNEAAANSLRNQMPALGVFADVLAPAFANASTPEGKATGGPVNAGQTYMVGEEGPELFTPGNSGNITPNDKLGGDETHINISGLTINASTYAGGQAAARGFRDTLKERQRENG